LQNNSHIWEIPHSYFFSQEMKLALDSFLLVESYFI
jgi:hypothetical protein